MAGWFISVYVVVVFVVGTVSCPGQTSERSAGIRVVDAQGQARNVELYDGSFALVIGMSNYTAGWNRLPGVRNDVIEVARILRQQGFSVEVASDLTSNEFDAKMQQFISNYGYTERNRLLVYFAGHGFTQKAVGDGRELGYVIPVDTPLFSQDQIGFRRRAISMDMIEAYARRIQARHAMFVFDSCFSGKLISRSAIMVPPVIQESVAYAVRQFITAGSADQSVPDVSVFRQAFVRGLEGDADLNHDGYVLASELASYLREKVTNYTNRAQTPQYDKIHDFDLDRGDMVFSADRTWVVSARARAAALAQESVRLTESCEYVKAIATATAALEADPQSAAGFTARGAAKLFGGDLEEASRDLSEAIRLEPDNPMAYRWRALADYALWYALVKRMSGPDTRELWKKDVATVMELLTNPREYWEYEARGYANYEQEKYELAIKDLSEAIRLKPDYALAYTIRGAAYYYRSGPNSDELARSDFNKALQLQPKFMAGYIFRAIVSYFNPQARVDNIRDLTESIRLAPRLNLSYAVRAEHYYDEGQFDLAIADFTVLIKRQPDNYRLYSDRAKAYRAQKNYPRALADLTTAIRLKPNDDGLYAGRAQSYSESGDYQNAINDYTTAIQLDPKTAARYRGRAAAYRKLGQISLALADERKASELAPK